MPRVDPKTCSDQELAGAPSAIETASGACGCLASIVVILLLLLGSLLLGAAPAVRRLATVVLSPRSMTAGGGCSKSPASDFRSRKSTAIRYGANPIALLPTCSADISIVLALNCSETIFDALTRRTHCPVAAGDQTSVRSGIYTRAGRRRRSLATQRLTTTAKASEQTRLTVDHTAAFTVARTCPRAEARLISNRPQTHRGFDAEEPPETLSRGFRPATEFGGRALCECPT